MKNLIRKILKEENNYPYNADREKVSTILNTIFSPLNDGSQFISINHIPFTFQYYSKGLGKTEEEIVEEFINLTPLQLYERTKLYEKEFRRSKYNL
jgi:hypothetical protein